jgi:hypothetical protein
MAGWDELSWFEIAPALLKPALMACRGFNTALDRAFYDVPNLERDLAALGESIVTARPNAPPAALDLDAVTNPEGALLVVDPSRAPYVTRFDALPDFVAWWRAAEAPPRACSVAGVGSSALGAAALAWNVAKALGEPVVAVVAGFGVADAVEQALGGWFGFGLHTALGTKSIVQTALANYAPQLALPGRALLASTPHHAKASTGAPTFERGSGSSDVLHALLEAIELRFLVGHSKGALVIGNALDGLQAEKTRGLEVVTLGCPIAEAAAGAAYRQYLGVFDGLGQLNAWGHPPTDWTASVHTTNRDLPLDMDAVLLVAEAAPA